MKLNYKSLSWLYVICLAVLLGCSSDDPKPLSNEHKILSFKFSSFDPELVGIIDEATHTITFEMPEGTDITNLTPTITLANGATISPGGDVAQDFSSPVVYTVTAQDGSTQEYEVLVVWICLRVASITMEFEPSAQSEMGPYGTYEEYQYNSDGMLERIVSGNLVDSFFYDNGVLQTYTVRQIVESQSPYTHDETWEYENEMLKRVTGFTDYTDFSFTFESDFYYVGNKLQRYEHERVFDDGLIVGGTHEFAYSGHNLSSRIYRYYREGEENEIFYSYTHDNNPNPYLLLATSTGNPTFYCRQANISQNYLSKNNPLTVTADDGSIPTRYSYVYNQYGYPSTITMEDEQGIYLRTFIYELCE